MLSGELLASQRRLAERAKAEKERALRKAEKERLLAERQRVREVALEEAKRQQRLQQLLREEAERDARERALELNNGVFWRSRLLAVPASADVAAAKGIRRAADKVLLPPSAGQSLLQQDALKNGTYFFELSHPSGRRTHAALLEFSSAEGFIGVPRKVMRCLYGPDAVEKDCDGPLDVLYRRLPKGTRAVFQPRSAEFQSAVGDGIREILETSLAQHSVLSTDDWIEVTAPDGRTFDLRVKHLEPGEAVSVIDTELEAEVLVSVETEERLAEEEAEARRRAAEEESRRRQEEEAFLRQQERAEAAAQDRRGRMETLAAALPPEPTGAPGHDDIIECLVRMPTGERYSRKFFASDCVGVLFDVVDSKGAAGRSPGSYRLVTQFPRRVIGVEERDKELREVGLPGPRELLFLEPIPDGAEV